jgi:hypothetical protein
LLHIEALLSLYRFLRNVCVQNPTNQTLLHPLFVLVCNLSYVTASIYICIYVSYILRHRHWTASRRECKSRHGRTTTMTRCKHYASNCTKR